MKWSLVASHCMTISSLPLFLVSNFFFLLFAVEVPINRAISPTVVFIYYYPLPPLYYLYAPFNAYPFRYSSSYQYNPLSTKYHAVNKECHRMRLSPGRKVMVVVVVMVMLQ
ncbi:hypothetical protein K504DRAFT_105353 [Pleomassaria siparia CBS 279.74]|uniref:Uncharacterized protein n=1 Tax=Pleomassaria siparia CBS 279.74 TaxID=1314801 RepID=A0A6G1JXN1_9PLEO|nr:hypothetical protein K504DRAFT_105353 [Pleomassaria siparia CBS 279.74]